MSDAADRDVSYSVTGRPPLATRARLAAAGLALLAMAPSMTRPLAGRAITDSSLAVYSRTCSCDRDTAVDLS